MTLQKTSLREIQGLIAQLKMERKQVSGMIPEDLMEMGADHLEDPFARSFFMTACGFSRLLQVISPEREKPQEAATKWLYGRFPQVKESTTLQTAIEQLANASLIRPNYNITLKRLTSVLTQNERAILAEGLLETLFPQGIVPPEKDVLIENTLTKILLSQQAAMEILVNWKRKKQTTDIPVHAQKEK